MSKYGAYVDRYARAIEQRQIAQREINLAHDKLNDLCPVPAGSAGEMIPHKGFNTPRFSAIKSLRVRTATFTRITTGVNIKQGWVLKGDIFDTETGVRVTTSGSGFYTAEDLATLGFEIPNDDPMFQDEEDYDEEYEDE